MSLFQMDLVFNRQLHYNLFQKKIHSDSSKKNHISDYFWLLTFMKIVFVCHEIDQTLCCFLNLSAENLNINTSLTTFLRNICC